MIVPMAKVYIVSHATERSTLLDALADLGVLHLLPIDPAKAVADEKTVAQIDNTERAILILSPLQGEKAGAGEADTSEITEEVLRLHHRTIELDNKLTSLHRQISHLEPIWGEVTLEQFRQLRDAGLSVRLYTVDEDEADQVQAQYAQPLNMLPGDRCVVAVIDPSEEIELPASAEELALPEADIPALRAKAADIDNQLKETHRRLEELAGHVELLKEHYKHLQTHAGFTIAHRGGMEEEKLFAIQGWLPQGEDATLADRLAERGISTAVQTMPPAEDETPPTLVRYPRWAKPMKAMFDILGTTPGYRESDLSPFFMIALPLFAAMLIGDAGYGLIFTAIGLLSYGKISAKAGKPAAQLLLVFGLFMLGWGLVTANIFGITPNDFAVAGGFANEAGELDKAALAESSGLWAVLATIMTKIGFLWNANSEAARNLIIKVSFIFGTIHLVLAHLRQAIGYAPNIRALGELGWCGFLVGMLGIIWMLFFPDAMWMPMQVMAVLLIAGGAMVILFTFPSRNPAKMLGLGIVANILPFISTFSDTMSYIRLMAVGLASYYIAKAFNTLAYDIGSGSAWMIPAAALIVVLAHTLNIILGVIAIFAHGVRLNMLEFSSNAGVQWTGHAYTPFSRTFDEGR